MVMSQAKLAPVSVFGDTQVPVTANLVGQWKADGVLWTTSARSTRAVADGDPVGAWDEAQASVNNLLQATTTKRGTLKLGQTPSGGPVVRFDGVDDFLTVAFTLIQPEHIFIVYKSIVIGASAVNDCILDGTVNLSMFYGCNTTPATSIYDGAASPLYSGLVCNTVFGQITALFNHAGGVNSSYIHENGTLRNLGDPLNNNNATGLTVGSSATNTRPTNIDVAEILVYSAVVSPSNELLIEAYLRAKWGTP